MGSGRAPHDAGVAQSAERRLPKPKVAGSRPVARSMQQNTDVPIAQLDRAAAS